MTFDDLSAAARDLAVAVNGIDWDASRVECAVDAIDRLGRGADVAALNVALSVLIERLRSSTVEEADGTAQLAITAGTLVEFGASPEPLAETLLEKIPSVLRAARRFANTCLADSRSPAECPEDVEPNVLTEVDQRPILRDVFRDHLDSDRPGGVALAYLKQWVLPTVASWTRARDWLIRAINRSELVDLANQMAESDAYWLRILLGAQLNASWLVLCPRQSRGFRMLVDGVVSNFDLHALLAAVLVPRGITGIACSDNIIAFIEGHGELPKEQHVTGTWNLYDYRAASFDLRQGDKVPLKYWVWGEGIPTDVPTFNGKRIMLIGPPSIERSWNLRRVFSELPCRVSVLEELTASEFQRELAAAVEATRGEGEFQTNGHLSVQRSDDFVEAVSNDSVFDISSAEVAAPQFDTSSYQDNSGMLTETYQQSILAPTFDRLPVPFDKEKSPSINGTHKRLRPWLVIRTIILAIFFTYVGVRLFRDIQAFEDSERRWLSLNWVFFLAYKLLGKWGATSVYALIASFTLWVSLFGLDKKQSR